MKKIMAFLIVAVIICSTASCAENQRQNNKVSHHESSIHIKNSLENGKDNETETLQIGTDNEVGVDGGVNTQNEKITNSESEIVPIGDSGFCSVHHEDYHFIPSAMITSDMLSDVLEWYEKVREDSKSVEGDCPFSKLTIKAFIDEFGIPKDKFEEGCTDLWTCIYDVDLLYTSDYSNIDAYFRDIDSRNKTVARQTVMRILKQTILTENNNSITNFNDISVAELVTKYGIEKNTLVSYIKSAEEKSNKAGGTFTYNLDVIFPSNITQGSMEVQGVNDNNGDIDISPSELDAMFCGIDNYYTD